MYFDGIAVEITIAACNPKGGLVLTHMTAATVKCKVVEKK